MRVPIYQPTPNESDPLALRKGVYDAVESCRLWFDVDEAGDSLVVPDGDTLLDTGCWGSATRVSIRRVLIRLSRRVSWVGLLSMFAGRLPSTQDLEGVLGST
jgi:hypothetical protein